ncbi:MAG: hypothetical protein H7839_19400 [Magnetococcus sp. YQC-5]
MALVILPPWSGCPSTVGGACVPPGGWPRLGRLALVEGVAVVAPPPGGVPVSPLLNGVVLPGWRFPRLNRVGHAPLLACLHHPTGEIHLASCAPLCHRLPGEQAVGITLMETSLSVLQGACPAVHPTSRPGAGVVVILSPRPTVSTRTHHHRTTQAIDGGVILWMAGWC